MGPMEQYIHTHFSEWIPMERLGMIHLDQSLPANLDGYEFRKDPEYDEQGDEWDTFKLYDPTSDSFYDELMIIAEDNTATVVSSHKFFYYKSNNIIGMPIRDVLALLDNPEYSTEEFEGVDDAKTIYEIDELELSILVDGDTVESVTCYGFSEE